MYNSEAYASDYLTGVGQQAEFEDLLMQYRVDAYIAGHYHAYERTCVLFNNTCTPDGVLHLTVGR